jgi:integrase/recombinase XerD
MQPEVSTKRPPQPLSEPEVRALLAACGRGPAGVRNRALIAVLWQGGLRVGEALALYPRDIRSNGCLGVRHGKNDRDRVVGLHQEADAVLGRWVAVRDGLGINGHHPVFCTIAEGTTRRRGDPLQPSYVRHLLKRLQTKAGIDRRVHAHGLRHTHAHDLVLAGVPLVDIRDQLGHRNASTTDIYLRRIAPVDRVNRIRSAIGGNMEG